MIELIKKYRWYLLTGAAVLILVFMHVYKLNTVPYGLNVDEASGAYDALNIARYGVDRYLKSYPVYFTNYGDGQNALYIYATALLIKIFGMSKYVIRATAALGAFAAAFFGYRYMKAKNPAGQAKTVWLCLYAILPVFIMSQRFGLESHLMLPLSMLSVFFVARALDTDEWKYYLGAAVVLGVTLYTYALTYIVIPVFLILMLIYGLFLKKRDWKKILTTAAILGVLATPLILVQMVNFFNLPEMQIGPLTITKVLEYRVDEVAGISVFENIKGILHNTFLFDDLKYNTLQKYGTMFYISIPFIVLGIGRGFYETYVSLRKKQFSYSVPMILWLLSEWFMGLFLSGNSDPNTTRMIGVFMPMLYFLTEGLYFVRDMIKRIPVRSVYTGVISVAYGTLFLHFAGYYFTDYNAEAYPMKWLFYESYEDVEVFLEEYADASWNERSICYPWNYIYYLLEYEVNPYEFNLPENGLERFGKDYINEYPDVIIPDANYVVYVKDTGSGDYLEQVGYQKLEAGADFYFFVSPLERYQQEIPENVTVTMDSFVIRDGQIRLNGWCAGAGGKACTAMKVFIGEDEYPAEMFERQDVAAHLGTTGSANYGFRISLPDDIFRERESIRIVGVNEEGTQEEMLSFVRK